MARVSPVFGLIGLCVAMAIVFAPEAGRCLEQKTPAAAKVGDAKRQPTDIQQFCVNNAAIMGDARIAWQTSKLLALEAQIKARLVELEAREAEYVVWLRKRDEAIKQAAESVVAIYGRMRPDAAALQLAAMDDSMAAAILGKLSSRSAGAILNEMEAGRAARLTNSMAGSKAVPDGKKS